MLVATVCSLVALSASFALGSCGSRGARSAPTTELVESADNRFPHTRHADLACTECHALDAVLSGAPAMPGMADHAPCDREQCHQPAFLSEPGPFCEVCHERVTATGAGMSPLSPYPPTRGRRELAAHFAHERHLDFKLMEQNVGFHVACTDCHALDDAGTPTRPGHGVCDRCHAPEAARAGMPAMNECQRCHRERAEQPVRRRRFIVDDLRFRHGVHQRDRRGTYIRCAECHEDTRTSRTLLDHAPPTTATCVTCHDDSERTPSTRRMRVCETCHRNRTRTIGVLAPRSHLPRLARPEDHTLAFRTDHGDAARDRAQSCARCHTFMSGAPRDVCDECHQVMRPHDHTVTWREFDHGSEATVAGDRCATCHKGTFCSSCHSLTPRSHQPLPMFRDGGHAMPAKLGMRACLTCHDPARSCTGSGCHTMGVR